ncbi:MAG: hypothetical protein KHW61_01115 [Clostridium sp.]|nr:hypothetical protein [Clostridium sp.]
MAVAARKLDNDYVYARSSTMRVYTRRMPAEADTPQAEAVAQPAVKPRYSPLQRLAVTCGILMSAIAILAIMVRYATITEQYAVVNQYKNTIEENKRTLDRLEVRLNSAVNLDEAREAALAAGLGYPAASQIVKIDGTDAGSVSSPQ